VSDRELRTGLGSDGTEELDAGALRILEALYDDAEPDPGDVELLASFRRVRELCAGLPEIEAPSGVSARLMAAAANQIETERRGQGFWARLRAWLEPITGHPALAAACSLVLVAAVGGTLYLSGKTDVAEPTAPGPAGEPAPAASTTLEPGVVGGAGSPEPSPDPPLEFEADVSAAQAQQTEKDVDKKEAAKPRPARARIERRALDERSKVRAGGGSISGKLEIAEGAEERPAGSASSAADDADGTRGAPASPSPRAPEAQAPSPPPPEPSREESEAPTDSLARFTAAARVAAERGDCPATRRLGARVEKIDAGYFRSDFVGDPAIAPCYRAPPNSPAQKKKK
jgi:hypothetical protein